jgi:hypothetical protein
VKALRYYCRNPRCREKLKSPVENIFDAFCCRGCHRHFFHTRCMVCEEPIKRTAAHQKLCKRKKCKNAFEALKAGFRLGKYHSLSGAISPSENPAKIGVPGRGKPDRPYRIVAGPELSERSFRFATLKPHPRIKWDIDNTASIGPKDWPVNII